MGVDGAHEVVDKCRSIVFGLVVDRKFAPCGVNLELLVLVAAVHSLVVHVHHVLTLAAVGLHDELLHLLHSKLGRYHLGDAEECRLQDGVGAIAQAYLLGNLGGVDIVDVDVVVGKVFLHAVGQVVGQLVALPHCVEQEGAVLLQAACHIIHVQVGLHVAGHKVWRCHQVGGVDGLVAETQVRAGEAARLLAVVGEIGLAVLVGVVAYDLHRVLVGSHCAVGTQSVEFGLEHALVAHVDFLFLRQRGEGDVVDNANGEVVFGHWQRQVLVDREYLGRSSVFRAQPVTTAHDERSILGAVEAVLHVEIQGLAVGARFLGAVEHGDALGCAGHGCQEMLGRERTVEVYCNQAHFLSLGSEVVDHFAYGFGHRAHCNDHTLGIGCAIVVKETVVAACDFVYLVDVFFYYGRNVVVVLIARLAVLEEDIGILVGAAGHRMVRIHCAVAEAGQSLAVQERLKVFLLQCLHFLNLVAGAESVEEIKEWHAALDCTQVCNCSQVHHLLHRPLAEHGKSRLTRCHHVLVVAEDAQRVRGQRAGCDVEHAWQQLAGNFIHVGYHQQQALRCRIGCGECTCLQRPVHSTGCTGFALHFLHRYCLAEDVFAPGGGPLVNVLGHGR